MERSRPRHSLAGYVERAPLERVIHCRKYDLVRLARYSTSAEIVFPGVVTNDHSVRETSDSVAGRFCARKRLHKLNRQN